MIVIYDSFCNILTWNDALKSIDGIENYNMVLGEYNKYIRYYPTNSNQINNTDVSIINYLESNKINYFLKVFINNICVACKFIYYKKKLNSNTYYPISDEIIFNISNKISLGLLLKDTDIHPNIYTSCESLLLNETENKIWFIKNAYKDNNEDIICLKTDQIKNLKLKRGYLIQEGVTNLDLYNNKKYTSRIIVLLHNKKMYFYKKYYSLIHKSEYNSKSLDSTVHTCFYNKEYICHYSKIIEVANQEMIDAIHESLKVFKKYIQNIIEQTDKFKYRIIECDYLYTITKKAILIEVNSYFNFGVPNPLPVGKYSQHNNNIDLNRNENIKKIISICVNCRKDLVKCILGLPYSDDLKSI